MTEITPESERNHYLLEVVSPCDLKWETCLSYPPYNAIFNMIRLLIAFAVLSIFLSYLYFLKKKEELDKRAYDILKRRYIDSLDDDNVPLMLAAGKDFSDFHALQAADLEQLYKDALRLVRENPDHKLYALKIGRRKYGATRKDGQPTIYDETAIQNDIEAAMK